ncbi:MAG: hypothetical protein ACM3TT_11415 [Syntrophothermus sp.]
MAECYNHPGTETDLNCSVCNQPICSGCQSFANGNPVCPACREQIVQELQQETQNPNIAGAVGLAVAAAIVSAVAWDKITFYSGYKLGLVAVIIGVLTGYAAYYGAGRKRGRAVQIVGAATAVLGILFGEYLLLSDAISAKLNVSFSPFSPGYARLFFTGYLPSLDALDYVFAAIGLYEGFKIPQAKQIKLTEARSVTGAAG